MSSDTFHVLPVGMLPNPGTCSTCGSDQRPCLDWGITVEYFGAVLICLECCRDLVNVPELQIVHLDEVASLMADNQRLQAREQEMQGVRRRLRSELMVVANDIDAAIAGASVVDDNPVPDLFAVAETPAVNFYEVFGNPSQSD